MLFHTWIFLVFFAVVYPIYLCVRHTRGKELFLLIASYTFYGWWNPLYLILIAWSTTIDFNAVRLMDRATRRKTCLALSIANNLLLLGFFKYAGFVSNNVNHLFAQIGFPYEIAAPGFLLPVGISFYIFQSMSYTIDFYRGKIDREKSFIRYACFVSLFPQLVAGPIERASNLLPQLRQNPKIKLDDVTDGLSLFVVGLFKKVALADYLALYVDQIYTTPERFAGPALMLATFAFAWQIYFDFSGYTDMARGVARMMGIRLMLNFNHPYLADSLGDFWNRWHISLSTWFKDYVYIPLGGNRKGNLNTYRNMFLTMVISGLWHGAAWTFVIWGLLHALGRCATRELEKTNFCRNRTPKFLKQLLIFIFVCFAWIFFRAANWDDACIIISRIFTSGWSDPRFPWVLLTLIFSVWIYQFACESRLKKITQLTPVRITLVIAMIIYLAVFASASNQPFIYFQF